jgi:hypothetical protein
MTPSTLLSTELRTESTRRLAPYLLAAFTLALVGWVATVVFHSEAFCSDEYSYLYQAKIFASGHLTFPVYRGFHHLTEQYVMVDHGQLFSKYAPLWPAVLAVGERLGHPGLVNPVLSTITVLIVYLTTLGFTTRRIALLAALILATNSYFLGYGASLFAQPLALTLSTAGIALCFRYGRGASAPLVAASAAVPALLSLSRLPDALCLAVAMGVGIAVSRGDWRTKRKHLAIFGTVAAVGPVLLCLYNHHLTGKFTLAVYPVSEGEFRVLVRGTGFWSTVAGSVRVYAAELARSAGNNFLYKFLPKIGPGLCGLVFIGVALIPRRERWVVGTLALSLVLLYNFHPGLGWPQYGARYWYPALGGLAIVAAGGLARIERRWGKTIVLAAALIVAATQLLVLPGDLAVYARRFDILYAVRADIFRHCPTPSVVVLSEPAPDSSWVRYRSLHLMWFDFRRNMFGAGPHYYTLSTRQDGKAVKELFPQRPVCVYEFDIFDHAPGLRGGPKS